MSAKKDRKSTGLAQQHEHWEDGFAKKVSEGILAAGQRLDPAIQNTVTSIEPGDILRLRVSATRYIAFSEDDAALGAATIDAAYAASPVLELSDTSKEYLISAPKPSVRGARIYYRMSAAPVRAEKIQG